MERQLEGKVAIVTGGTRGIGHAIAEKFIGEGARVAVFDLQAGQAEQQEAKFYQVDVSKTTAVEEAIQQVIADFGQIDILINNAGITRDNLLMRLKEQDWDDVINVNLKSCYNTCHAVYRPMIKAKAGGKIINISSVIGLTGNAGQVNYSASKSGVIGLTRSLARELALRGICVNAIAPGFIETPMTAALNEKQREATLAQIPMKRLGTPEDIANAVLFLASPSADYITGQVLTVDGGMVM